MWHREPDRRPRLPLHLVSVWCHSQLPGPWTDSRPTIRSSSRIRTRTSRIAYYFSNTWLVSTAWHSQHINGQYQFPVSISPPAYQGRRRHSFRRHIHIETSRSTLASNCEVTQTRPRIQYRTESLLPNDGGQTIVMLLRLELSSTMYCACPKISTTGNSTKLYFTVQKIRHQSEKNYDTPTRSVTRGFWPCWIQTLSPTGMDNIPAVRNHQIQTLLCTTRIHAGIIS